MANRKFQNQIALVTGASRGIGRATALALAREGAHLVLAARSEDDLNKVADQVRALDREALAVPTDVTDPAQIDAAVKAALERFGCVDILIANAGVYYRRPVHELTAEDVEQAMAVNFYGVLHAILAVLPGMRARRHGHIVIVNSLDGKKGLPQDTPYVVSKFALAGLGDVMRQELAGAGVNLSSIFPGRVDTPMIEHLRVPWISSKIPAEAVAGAIIRAIERNKAETVVPLIDYAIVLANTFSPRFADWFVRRFHIEGSESQTEKEE